MGAGGRVGVSSLCITPFLHTFLVLPISLALSLSLLLCFGVFCLVLSFFN